MKNKLNLYVRLDANNMMIASSTVYRKTMPKVGRWKQIESPDVCCGTFYAVSKTLGDAEITDVDVTISCDGNNKIFLYLLGDSTDITTLTTLLNEKAGYLGKWVNDGNLTITLQMKPSVFKSICSDVNDLGLDIFAD